MKQPKHNHEDMTYEEAIAFIEQLKSNKKYVGQIQRATWGLSFLSVNSFDYWIKTEGDNPQLQQEKLSEDGLILLLENHDYQIMLSGLRG